MSLNIRVYIYGWCTYNHPETVFQRRTMAPDVIEKHWKLCQVERVRQTRTHYKTFPREHR